MWETCHIAFFLKCLQSIYERLKFLPNRLGNVECLLRRLVTIHFLPFLFIYMQCSLQSIWAILCFNDIVGSLVHACFLHLHWFLICLLLLFLFSCLSCCSLHIWGSATAIGTATFLVDWLLLASLFVGYCLLLFDSTLQGSGPVAAIGPFGAS